VATAVVATAARRRFGDREDFCAWTCAGGEAGHKPFANFFEGNKGAR
jgi:hypothetical protein